MSALQKVVAAVIALLVVAGVAVVALSVAGAPNGQAAASPGQGSPIATGSAPPSASAAPTIDPSAPDEEETLAILREIEEQVIAIRGLPSAEIGPPDIISRAELGDELERIFEEEYPPEEQERDNISLRAMGLLEPGQDVAELQLQLLGDQVLGFYDDVEQRMVVVTDAGLDAEAKLTYAHEYTHALQDAAFGLDELETDAVGEDDRGLARTAMIEGDATVTMLAWAFEHLSPEELLEIGSGTELPDTSGIPAWMVNQLQFPYNEGSLWAGTLTGDPLTPDFDDLDAAYADPPDSTEQIIDIRAWTARDEPIPVEVADIAAALGDDWEEVDATPIGQASIRIMLEYLGVTRDEATAAASGWGGDRAVVASGPNDSFALAWRLVWDSDAEAAAFAEAYRNVTDGLPFPAAVVEEGNGEILVLHASDDDVLRRTLDAAGG